MATTATNKKTGEQVILVDGQWSPFSEDEFQRDYGFLSRELGIDPNPDAPEHMYDYRTALASGKADPLNPEHGGHWPSQFKAPEHPNRYVDGVDTISGKPAKTATNPETKERLYLHEGTNQWLPLAIKPEGGFKASMKDIGLSASTEPMKDFLNTAIAATETRQKGKFTFSDPNEEAVFKRTVRNDEARLGRKLNETELDDLRKQYQSVPPEAAQQQLQQWEGVLRGAEAAMPDLPERERSKVTQAVMGFARFAPSMVATAASGGLGAGVTMSQLYGAKYGEYRDQGIDPDQADAAAFATAVMSTPVEYAGNVFQLKLLKPLAKSFGLSTKASGKAIEFLTKARKTVGGRVAAAGGRIGAGGATEGMEEGVQAYAEAAGDILAKNPNDKPKELLAKFNAHIQTPEFKEQRNKSIELGAIGGTIFGGAGQGMGMLSGGKKAAEQAEVEEAPQAQPDIKETLINDLNQGTATAEDLQALRADVSPDQATAIDEAIAEFEAKKPTETKEKAEAAPKPTLEDDAGLFLPAGQGFELQGQAYEGSDRAKLARAENQRVIDDTALADDRNLDIPAAAQAEAESNEKARADLEKKAQTKKRMTALASIWDSLNDQEQDLATELIAPKEKVEKKAERPAEAKEPDKSVDEAVSSEAKKKVVEKPVEDDKIPAMTPEKGPGDIPAKQASDQSPKGGKRYPVKFGEKPNISSSTTFNENLFVYLDEPGTDQMIERFGSEKIKNVTKNIVRADGEFGSWRYIYRNEDGDNVGMIQGVSSERTGSIISNAYVRPDYRRKGVASKLLKIIDKQKDNISIDGGMSKTGAALMGYESLPNQSSPPEKVGKSTPTPPPAVSTQGAVEGQTQSVDEQTAPRLAIGSQVRYGRGKYTLEEMEEGRAIISNAKGERVVNVKKLSPWETKKSETEAPTSAEALGTAWIGNQWKPIVAQEKVTRGKYKGRIRVTLPDGKKRVVKESALRLGKTAPADPGGAESISTDRRSRPRGQQDRRKVSSGREIHEIAKTFNAQHPGNALKYDGQQDRTALKKPPLHSFTAYEGPAKGASFSVEKPTIENIKSKLDEMVDLRTQHDIKSKDYDNLRKKAQDEGIPEKTIERAEDEVRRAVEAESEATGSQDASESRPQETKREKSLSQYREYIDSLSDEQQSKAGNLIVDNPSSPSLQTLKIKKALRAISQKTVQDKTPPIKNIGSILDQYYRKNKASYESRSDFFGRPPHYLAIELENDYDTYNKHLSKLSEGTNLEQSIKLYQEQLDKPKEKVSVKSKKTKRPAKKSVVRGSAGKNADRFRKLADNSQKQIDDKRREMTQNPTPKRMRDYRGRLHDADNMERMQQAFYAMADAIEAGVLPKILEDVKTKASVQSLVRKGLTGGGGYYDVIPSNEYADKSNKGIALQKLMEKSLSGEQVEAQERRAKEKELKDLEESVRFSKIPGFFPTPKQEREGMVDEADIEDGMSVLEPQAGKGDIADTINEMTGIKPDVVEIVPTLQKILEMKGYNLVGTDFLDYTGKKYDRIIMNPPFEKLQDVDHVKHAYSLLKPGGRLVSIMGESPFQNSTKKAVAFREWFESVGGETEGLGQAFKGTKAFRQTGVTSRRVVIDKAEGSGVKSLLKSQTGSSQLLTDVVNIFAKDQTETKAFKDWFGKSAVVDSDGKPLVVYHGTRREFDAFEPLQPLAAPGNPKGIYFTSAKHIAEEFAQDVDGATDEKSRIIPAYLKIENDKDGIIRKDSYGDTEYIVFTPTQIKSAIGNSGKFDPKNPSIIGESQLISDVAFHGAELIRKGVKTYRKWFYAMKKRFAKHWAKIKKFMRRVWDAVSNERGLLGGERAKTANKSNLSQAVEMDKSGVDMEDIRRETGWFSGMDDKWRFEIDDSKLKLKNLKIDSQGVGDRATWIGEILNHKDLYRAYPELENTDVQIMIDPDMQNPRGSFSPFVDRSGQDLFDQQPQIDIYAKTKKEAKEILLHEIQHAIQEIEGFAKGGSPRTVSVEELMGGDKKLKKFTRRMDDLSWDGLDYGSPQMQKIRNERDAYVKETLKKKYGDNYGMGAYRHLAGEIEARDTAERADLTSKQRIERKPYASQGIPKERAIIRFGGGGDQLSVSNERGGTTLERSGKPGVVDLKARYFSTSPPQKAKTVATSKPRKGYLETLKPVTAQDYIDNRATRKSAATTALRNARSVLSEIAEGTDAFLGSISTRLGNISPKLKFNLRRLDSDIAKNAAMDIKSVEPMLRKVKKKMTRNDVADWDYARKNSDTDKINELVSRYNLKKEYAAYRKVLDDIRKDAVDVGLAIGEIEEYAPRVLKDSKGFLKAIEKGDDWPVFTRKIKERAEALGISLGDMTQDMKADIISNMIAGGNYGLTAPPATKNRKLKKIPAHLNQYYMDSDSALVAHVYTMRKGIEARRFFGKVPGRVAAIKKKLHLAQNKLREINKALAETSSSSTEKDKLSKRKNKYFSLTQQYWAYLDKYANQRDYRENIGSYVLELIEKGDIKPSQERIVGDILNARFHEKGTHGVVQAYKNLSYIDTMGSPFSALTQIGDLAWAAYDSGLARALKNASRSLTGKSKITKEDVGIERIAQEFSDPGKLSAAVSWVFKAVGLEKMDSIGKEALLNGALEKYQKQSKNSPAQLKKQIRAIFENETDGVIDDLKSGDITDNVKLLVYNRLLDFQPVALSEMPQKYLSSGNGRVFYMLKTFTIKQFDVFRNEAYNKIKNGDRAEKIQGIANAARLAMFFVLANAGADELKDWLLGRKTDFSDRMVDNALRLFGISKFVTWKARTEGVGSAMAKQVLPPFKFIDAATKDIYRAGDDKGLESVSSIPLVGKLYYWHLGAGKNKRGDLWNRRFSKEKKRLKKVRDGLERSKNKRDYFNKHRRELGAYNYLRKAQSRLNKNRSIINRLKGQRETPSIKKRIQELEEIRVIMIKRYLERLKTTKKKTE